MVSKIDEYKLIRAALNTIEPAVNEALAAGWELYGAPMVYINSNNVPQVLQGMVKPSPADDLVADGWAGAVLAAAQGYDWVDLNELAVEAKLIPRNEKLGIVASSRVQAILTNAGWTSGHVIDSDQPARRLVWFAPKKSSTKGENHVQE